MKTDRPLKKYLKKITHPPGFTPLRIFKSMWRQKSKTPICPDQPKLNGKLAIVTGGNDGIGFETSKGLAERGSDVIILSRNEEKSKEAIRKIKAEDDSKVHFIQTDLGDIESILAATKNIAKEFPGRKIDIFVANAGVPGGKNLRSAQGYEMAFAVNVLGHHVLFRSFIIRPKCSYHFLGW